MDEIIVTKASGDTEVFSSEKLRRSLKRAGASNEIIKVIIGEVLKQLKPRQTTKKIYRRAHQILRTKSKALAAKYKLKQALLEMGPSGHPFERLVSHLLTQRGYKTKVGLVLDGKCVSHEVDVIADNEYETLVVECKFHNRPGVKSNVKVPLYVNSRFRDLLPNLKRKKSINHKFTPTLVTNTRFTSDAQKYGACAGVSLISWDYPLSGNLKDAISRSGLYPITVVESLSRKDKEILMANGIVLCHDLLETRDDVAIAISPSKLRKAQAEVRKLTSHVKEY